MPIIVAAWGDGFGFLELRLELFKIAAGGDCLAVVIHDLHARAEMRRDSFLAPRIGRDSDAVAREQESREVGAERIAGRLQVADDLCDFGFDGLQFAAERARQGTQPFANLFGAQAGHTPLDGGGRKRTR